MRKFMPVKNAPADTLLPVRSTSHSAGYDIFIPQDLEIPAHSFSPLVPLNIKVYMEHDEYFGIVIRSSLATTKGKLRISQGEAIIDADYADNPTNDGNIGLMFHNDDDKPFVFKKGDRCAQGIFKKYYITDDDTASGQRDGGFGSTGK